MIKTTIGQDDWLDSFCKIHNLDNYEEALTKLIECYQVWNTTCFHGKARCKE